MSAWVLCTTGLIESWSNLYTRFAIAMDARTAATRGNPQESLVYPDLEHGIDGIRWVTKCVESDDKGGVWVDFQVSLPISSKLEDTLISFLWRRCLPQGGQR